MAMSVPVVVDYKRELLRHTVATVAYRGGKAIRGASPEFGDFQIAESTRTPVKILAHIGDLMDWALSMARGKEEWHDSTPLPWVEGMYRFFASVQAFDDYLASPEPLAVTTERLFQGAIADALAHIGQLGMLRRLAGSPVRAENYSRAEIVAGRVGPEQTPAKREFD